MDDWRHGGFGLYVHWPFCEAKCPYCDFNSHVARFIDHDAWLHAYLNEIDRTAALTGPRVLNSIYFGGGTPSLMEPRVVEQIIERASQHWDRSNSIEITLEANPSSVEFGKFQDFRTAGINRVSLGLQALNDDDLGRLGRVHTVDDGLAALDVAMKTFDRVSIDLMYGRQHQSLEAWQTELDQATSFGTHHMSLYQLTVEDGTAFGRLRDAGKLAGLPEEETSVAFHDMTLNLMQAAGFDRYETSNFGRNDDRSHHNLIYWNSGDYAGVGPGAHGRLTLDGARQATETWLAPGKWLKAVQDTNSGTSVSEKLNAADHANEMMLMGLRNIDGVDVGRWESVAAQILVLPDELSELGLVEICDNRLKATNTGHRLLNQVIERVMI